MSLIEFYCMPCQRSAPSSVDTTFRLLLKHRIPAILVWRHAIITLTSHLDDALSARRLKIYLYSFNLADVCGQRRPKEVITTTASQRFPTTPPYESRRYAIDSTAPPGWAAPSVPYLQTPFYEGGAFASKNIDLSAISIANPPSQGHERSGQTTRRYVRIASTDLAQILERNCLHPHSTPQL
jgi:hypothetical protein